MIFIQRMLIYAVGGVFAEVVFTALKSLYYHTDLMLHGNTQLWVILMYSFGGILFEFFQQIDYRLRVSLYVVFIYAIEYFTGWCLHHYLGACPWHYHEAGNVHGLIQLAYIPWWAIFAVLADNVIYIAVNYRLVYY